MRSKAAVLYTPGGDGLVFEDLDLLEPRANEVLVRYVASGVCHSDLHHIQGKVGIPTPIVMGHEGAGVVEAIGPGVNDVSVGDHVLTSYIPSCGQCPYCVVGRPNLCDLRDKPRNLLHDGTTRNDPDVVPASCHGDQNGALAESGARAVKADFVDAMRRTTWVAAGLIALTFLLGYLLPRTARPDAL